MKKVIILFCISNFVFQFAFAEEVVDIEGSSIIGNREAPRVLYIVPWNKSQLPTRETLPIDILVEDAMSSIDRNEFKRQVNFFQQINSK
ncbi:MAG: hypothetical protein BMS9Abin31_1341 [Gammaproteobacteria bacterium]|nr:MAG: hypothetical protein BMS9Abin31_1341 [Gammaproteobacteria bacterium]